MRSPLRAGVRSGSADPKRTPRDGVSCRPMTSRVRGSHKYLLSTREFYGVRIDCCRLLLFDVGLQKLTTNLGVRSSNLFGRANEIGRFQHLQHSGTQPRQTPGDALGTQTAFLESCGGPTNSPAATPRAAQGYCRCQLFANAAIAASRGVEWACVGVRSSCCPKASVHLPRRIARRGRPTCCGALEDERGHFTRLFSLISVPVGPLP